MGTPEIEDLWSPLPFGLALIDRYPEYLYSGFDCCLYSISVLNKRYYVIFTSVLFLSSTFKMPFCQPKSVAVWVITTFKQTIFFSSHGRQTIFSAPVANQTIFFHPFKKQTIFFQNNHSPPPKSNGPSLSRTLSYKS